jgi:hypothetical protein
MIRCGCCEGKEGRESVQEDDRFLKGNKSKSVCASCAAVLTRGSSRFYLKEG